LLWPLLDSFPSLPVTVIEPQPKLAADLTAVATGGIGNLRVHVTRAEDMDFAPGQFDGATALEVLEHVSQPLRALERIGMAVRRFVVVSVPSRPDDNPEHLRFLHSRDLAEMFGIAGFAWVSFGYVVNHTIAVARR
jgi:hypothetical protein